MAFPVFIVLGAVGLAAAAIASFASQGKECDAVDTRQVTLEQVTAVAPAIQAWAAKWQRLPDGPAQTAFVELARIVYPDCKWNTTVKTKLILADGSSIGFDEIMRTLGDKKVREMSTALAAFAVNLHGAGGGGQLAAMGLPSSVGVLLGES